MLDKASKVSIFACSMSLLMCFSRPLNKVCNAYVRTCITILWSPFIFALFYTFPAGDKLIEVVLIEEVLTELWDSRFQRPA